MKKWILWTVWTLLTVWTGLQAQCPIKSASEKIVKPLLCLDTLGRNATPDSAHITTYKDDGTFATYFARSTTYPFTAASIDTTRPNIGGTAPVLYWLSETISNIDGTASNATLAINVQLWWKGYATDNMYCVQMVADSLNDAIWRSALAAAAVMMTISDSSKVSGTAFSGLNNIIKTNSFAAGAIDANAIATDAIGAAEVAASALAKGTEITGFNDIAATAIVSGGAITTSGGAVSTVTTTTTATNVTTVNGLAAGVITATSIASDAITAAKIADAAIDSNTLALDARKLIAIRADSGSALRPTTAGRTLDVTATGEAGIDLDNTAGTLAKTTDITGFNDIAATAIVSSGAITTSGGAVTTVTNLTNAPTSGDLTSTMKTSVENAVWDAAKASHTTANSYGTGVYIDTANAAHVGISGLELMTMTGLQVWTTSTPRQLTGNYKDSVASSVWSAGTRTLTSAGSGGMTVAEFDSITQTWASPRQLADSMWTLPATRRLTELDEDNTTIDLNASTIGTVNAATLANGAQTITSLNITAGVTITNSTANEGVKITGGAGKDGLGLYGGSTTGNGLYIQGTGASSGLNVLGGATGAGAKFSGGSTSGSGICLFRTGSVAGQHDLELNNNDVDTFTVNSVTTVAGVGSGAITSSSFGSGAINEGAVANGALRFGQEIDTVGNEQGVKTEATSGGGGATAADIWSYGTRTLTSGGGSGIGWPFGSGVMFVDAVGGTGLDDRIIVIDTATLDGACETCLTERSIMVRDHDDNGFMENFTIERVECAAGVCSLQVDHDSPFAFEVNDSVWFWNGQQEYLMATVSETADSTVQALLTEDTTSHDVAGTFGEAIITGGLGTGSGSDTTDIDAYLRNHGIDPDTLGARLTAGQSHSIILFGQVYTPAQLSAEIAGDTIPVNVTKTKGSSVLVIDTARNSNATATVDSSAQAGIANQVIAGLGTIGNGNGAYADTIFVFDGGTAISGLRVSVYNSDESAIILDGGRTDDNGRYICNLDAATYKIRVAGRGVDQVLNPQSQQVTTNGANDTVIVNLPAAPFTYLYGQELFPDTLKYAVVELELTNYTDTAMVINGQPFTPQTKYTTRTDSTGAWEFRNVVANELIDAKSRYIFRLKSSRLVRPKTFEVYVPDTTAVSIQDLY